MLSKIDLNQKIDKPAYKEQMADLSNRLTQLQKASWEADLPVVIVFEGWDAAGKGAAIQKLAAPLDPRGFKVYPIRAARSYEKRRPWLWRFWLKLPARGEWAIFDRSWYGRVMIERVQELIPESEWRRAYRDIVNFESTIADDGAQILKFFLHISKSEQRRRFDKLTKDPLTAWRVSEEDWEQNRHFEEWTLAYEEAFERTESEWAPWTIVEATDKHFAWVKIYQTVIQALEARLGISSQPAEPLPEDRLSEPEAIRMEIDEDLSTPEERAAVEAPSSPEASLEVKTGALSPARSPENDVEI